MIESFFDNWMSFFVTAIIFIGLYLLTKLILDRQGKGKKDSTVIRTIILFTLALIGIIAVMLAIPMPSDIKGQITSLLGIVISAVFALSSATFIGNGLAGIMLRSINNFKPGDFIRVGDHFGRISERGLFHTEIQTDNRDLTTLPNLYLATNPVNVTRKTGTFISGEVSLGYDVSRIRVEKLLLGAAKNAGLTDAFVYVTSLGDFSVVYKVHGLLKDVKTILTGRSKLNAMMLDALHEDGIEIMSPTFVGQRQVNEIEFIPKKAKAKEVEQLEKETKAVGTPENIIFDKAEEAKSIEDRKEHLENINQKIVDLNMQKTLEKDSLVKEKIEHKKEQLEKIKEKIETRIVSEEVELDNEK
jgi:small-conductance mechanosensitive channel